MDQPWRRAGISWICWRRNGSFWQWVTFPAPASAVSSARMDAATGKRYRLKHHRAEEAVQSISFGGVACNTSRKNLNAHTTMMNSEYVREIRYDTFWSKDAFFPADIRRRW